MDQSQVLELKRDKEAILWGASERGSSLQPSEEDIPATHHCTIGINSNNSSGISNDKCSISYIGDCGNDTIGTSYRRQSSTTTNGACTETNSSHMRTIASHTTHQFVESSSGTPLINDSINQRSDTGRSIHVNSDAATDVTSVDGHVLVTSGTIKQQHRHCSTVIGGMLLRHGYIHPTDMKLLFDYGEIPASDDIDISTVTDSNIDGYRSISTGRGTSIGYDMDVPNLVSVSSAD